jgi:hypothetical protein
MLTRDEQFADITDAGIVRLATIGLVHVARHWINK